ncbi:hypothetical protein G3480_24775 [Thiorhodococcus mannitoliphagus]|uniref:Calcineurin-like phosphoesterase domain-containing protein n=1 Tax=Thiorhodococcus mannitoliphagus TaxID=329406 RepID=A0A6P1E608_9GAMM|nr:metallophosphoesterase [Thiorhodococcus mannitoliphagus]NEX23464.1 hypothetical protein [Thiorhodococcus mannitoliphagus]
MSGVLQWPSAFAAWGARGRSLLAGAVCLLGLLQTQTARAAIPPDAGVDGVLVAYTLVAPESQSASGLIARAVIPAGLECPNMLVAFRPRGVVHQGRRVEMDARLAPATTAPAFSALTVCEAAIPQGAIRVNLGHRELPASLPRSLREIAVLGDTGCRIKGSDVQDCGSTAEWPLARIAARIAERRPDVVLYLGDFYYREAACPPDQEGLCGTSPPPLTGAPFTDSAYGWLADVLLPLAPLFPMAPLVILQGNHEACDRGGNGYFLFFDPFMDSADVCAPIEQDGVLVAPPPRLRPTWSTDLRIHFSRTLRLALVDATYGGDGALTSWSEIQRQGYEEAARLTSRSQGVESWLLVHRPIFGHVTDLFKPADDPLWTPWTSVDQQVASLGLLDNYDLILSSHLHVAQAVQIPDLPAQIVLGNGGTLLDPASGYETPTFGPLADATGAPLIEGVAPYPPATMDKTAVRFGYAVAHPGRETGDWSWEHYTPEGALFAQCTQSGPSLRRCIRSN